MLKKYFTIFIIVLFFSACVSTGNQQLANMSQSDIGSIVVNGQTTKSEVRAALGDPSLVDLDNNGNEKWTYYHLRSTIKGSSFIPVVSSFKSGSNNTTRQLVILYDDDGVVINHVFTQSQGQTNTGILG